MPHGEISSLSEPELRVRLDECRQAREAERVAQREAAETMIGTAATDSDVSSCAARIHSSQTVIQKLDRKMASLGRAARERASPLKTRDSNSEPTSKPQTADSPSKSEAKAALARLLANSTKEEDEEATLVADFGGRSAPPSPLPRRGPMVKALKRARALSPGKPPVRAASPGFKRAMNALNGVGRSASPRASIAPGPAPAGGV